MPKVRSLHTHLFLIIVPHKKSNLKRGIDEEFHAKYIVETGPLQCKVTNVTTVDSWVVTRMQVGL